MKCCLRLPTCVGKLLCLQILIISLSFSSLLTEDKVRSLAEEKLSERFGDTVRLSSFDTAVRLPLKYEEIKRIKLSAREGYPRGTLHIYLKTRRGSRVVSVSLNLKWKCEILVASERIKRGERIYPWQVALKETFKSRCPKRDIEDPQELINYVALRNIRKGMPIKKSYLKKSPLVVRGQEVDVVYRSGNVEISFPATALENGFWGDTVRVKSKNTGKILIGRVMAEGVVVLE